MKPKAILFFTLSTILFAGSVYGQLCRSTGSFERGRTKDKMIGDVRALYTLIDEYESFEIRYSETLLDKKTETSCHKLLLNAAFYSNGKKLTPPESVSLTFSSVSNAYKYAEISERRLKIIADGETIFQGELERRPSVIVPKKSYSEILSTEFDFATFEKFARKKNITFHLGKTAFTLTEKQIAAFRQMSELVEKQPNADELFNEMKP